MNPMSATSNAQEPANTNDSGPKAPRRDKRVRPKRPSARAKQPPTNEGKGRFRDHDQLVVERIENLHQLEGFLCSAVIHIMRAGLPTPLEWPALLQRPNGTSVQAPEHVIERAISLLEALCLSVDKEIRDELNLAPEVERRKYRVLPRRPKDNSLVDNWLPVEETPEPNAREPSPPAPAARANAKEEP